jgi:glycosyltransferase involved in cell wall biosynthesis
VPDSPDVSVVIPTRSRWHLLSTAALPSALEQEDVEIEVIVVDDGSQDETPARLRDLADPRLVVIRHETSRGVAIARNAGIAAARGRWVSFLDDDDLWGPRKLRGQLDSAEAADAVFAYAGGGGLDAARTFLFAVPPPDPATVTEQLLRWNVIWCGCSNVLARSDVVTELGGFDERLVQLADWDLWIRLALAGPAAATSEILVGYVMHDESMLLTDRREVFPEMDYLVEKHGDAARAHGVELDQALFTRWVARGHRRAGRRLQAARTFLRGARLYADLGALPRALGSFAPERLVDVSRRVGGVERRSSLKTERVPEPDWIARFRA